MTYCLHDASMKNHVPKEPAKAFVLFSCNQTKLFQKFLYIYRPQRSCGQGYVFTRVCDSVHGGVSPAGRTPPGKETPLARKHPPPPGKENPPPGHTVNERPVRILLECILVGHIISASPKPWQRHGLGKILLTFLIGIF